jgi:hypothetical protein
VYPRLICPITEEIKAEEFGELAGAKSENYP